MSIIGQARTIDIDADFAASMDRRRLSSRGSINLDPNTLGLTDSDQAFLDASPHRVSSSPFARFSLIAQDLQLKFMLEVTT